MENCLIINGLHSTANCGHKRALAGVVPPHGLPTRFTISTISRQTVKTRISCSLKRFLRTTGQKTVTTCAENVLARTPKQVVPDFSIYKASPGGLRRQFDKYFPGFMAQYVTLEPPAGRGHASDFRDIDYQLVIKSNVETQPKNVGVSTLSLKIRLIINWLPYQSVAASRLQWTHHSGKATGAELLSIDSSPNSAKHKRI